MSQVFLQLVEALGSQPVIKLEIRVSQNLMKHGGRPIKCQGCKGERIGVNCVARYREGEFQHWL